jgi:hypothetical protein
MTDTTRAWLPGENDGKVVRITNPSSPAYGQIYAITGTTATTIIRADTSTPPATVTAITGSGASRTVCVGTQSLIAANRVAVGRSLKDQTGATGLLKIVASANNDPACPASGDSFVVMAEPDPLLILQVGDAVSLSDGVRAGDTYEILDYAHVAAEAGPACTAPTGGSGVAYILARAGSETLIRYAEICNLGKNASNRNGITFSSVNGATPGEGVTIDTTRIRAMGYRPINLTASRNNEGQKGIHRNSISNTGSYGIVLASGSASNAITHNRIWDTTNSVSLEPGAAGNVIAFNEFFGNRGLNGNGLHNAGVNNALDHFSS